MRKKFLIFVLIIAAIFAFITLFSYKNKNQDKNAVVFWTLQLGTFDKYINNIIKEFEQENPEIKIKWVDVPYSEGEKRILASILTDNPPDLVNLTPDFSILLAQKKALQTIDKKYLEQFIPEAAEILKYKGEYFGIPFYATSAVTLYNYSLIDIKKLPETYDDLFEVTPPDGKYITMLNFTENDTILKLLNKYNINSPDTINSRKSIQIYSEFKRLYDNNLIPKESITQTHRDSLEKYMSDQLVFLVTGGNFLNIIKENAPSVYKTTKILPQLTGDTGKYDCSLMNFIIPKKAKNKDLALKFALFFTNKANQLEFAHLTPILPVNKAALEDKYFQNYSTCDIQEISRAISAQQLHNLQLPYNTKNKKELNTLSSNCVQKILIKNAPVKETLEDFSNDWKKLL